MVPNAPVVAHGINNSTELLPLGRGLDAQRAYVRRTLDLIQKSTGVRSRGWSSPSVYPNADTFRATAAEGIGYSLDGMDSDVLSRLAVESGRLVLIPYPAVTVDMGQYLSRLKEPGDLERLWIDYVTELAREADADPSREATIVAIGIHPFVVGTPAGAAALRRVLENFKKQKLVWLTDVEAVLTAGKPRAWPGGPSPGAAGSGRMAGPPSAASVQPDAAGLEPPQELALRGEARVEPHGGLQRAPALGGAVQTEQAAPEVRVARGVVGIERQRAAISFGPGAV